MARRRSRKDSGVLELVLKSEWPVAATMATVVAIVGFWLMPAWFASNPMLAQIPTALRPVVWLLFGSFVIIAVVKYGLAQRIASRRRMNDYMAHDAAERFVHGAVAKAKRTQPRPSPALNASSARDHFSTDPEADRELVRKVEQALKNEVQEERAPPKPTAWSLDLMQHIEWKRFEDICAAFYREKGIRCVTTALGPDGGIDIRLMQDEGNPNVTTGIVQCKAWGERLVGVKPVRELLGVMTHEKIAKAFFMTSGGFTDDARSVASANRITLLDGNLFLAVIERLSEASQQRLLAFATEGDYTTPTCPRCGVKMVAREGAKGRFWGCVAYPKCRQILNMRKEQSGVLPNV